VALAADTPRAASFGPLVCTGAMLVIAVDRESLCDDRESLCDAINVTKTAAATAVTARIAVSRRR
jgi:hypothetical protein